MILPAVAFTVLIVAAVILTAATPVILLALLFRDLMKGTSW